MANNENARKSVHTIRCPTSSLVAKTPARKQFGYADDFTVFTVPGFTTWAM
jgi:hypothetical protein